MTHAHLTEIEAAIARDEQTNPDAYYEYQGTIDEAHTRRQAHDVLTVLQHPLTDRAFLAPDGKWTTERADACASCDDIDAIPVSRVPAAAHRGRRADDTTLPTDGPDVNYGASGI